jgi:hypothetical protein
MIVAVALNDLNKNDMFFCVFLSFSCGFLTGIVEKGGARSETSSNEEGSQFIRLHNVRSTYVHVIRLWKFILSSA